MKDKNIISLLVANYNNGKFFKDCYQSILNQTSDNWKVVILDDGSQDDSLDIIRKLTNGDDRVAIFENKINKGAAFTKSRLIDLADTNIVGFLDPDDALSPDAIESMLSAYNENAEVGLVYSNYVECDEMLRPNGKIHYGKQVIDYSNFYNLNWEVAHFVTFRKDLYNQTDKINIHNFRGHDQDLYLLMSEVAPVLYINKNLYLYRIHNGSLSSFENSRKAYLTHWIAIIEAAKRRGQYLEDLMYQHLTQKHYFDQVFEELNQCKLHPIKKLVRNIKSYFKNE